MVMMMLLREIFRSKKKEQQKMKKSMGKLYLSVWGLEKCFLPSMERQTVQRCCRP
jgi:hypothetical protein